MKQERNDSSGRSDEQATVEAENDSPKEMTNREFTEQWMKELEKKLRESPPARSIMRLGEIVYKK